jgi:hypothetical protein
MALEDLDRLCLPDTDGVSEGSVLSQFSSGSISVVSASEGRGLPLQRLQEICSCLKIPVVEGGTAEP